MRTKKSELRGDYYYCVDVPQEVSSNKKIWVMADVCRVEDGGSLVFYGHKMQEHDAARAINLALASGQWHWVYLASNVDGEPVAVDSWSGDSPIYEDPLPEKSQTGKKS